MSDTETPRILVVDDDPVTTQALRLALASDYSLEFAQSDGDAFAVVGSGDPPDLVLLSTSSKIIDGYGLCRALKEQRATLGLPVILLRESTAADNETLGLEAGAVDHLTTPFEMATARARVRTHLELKWLREQAENALSLDSLTELPDRTGVAEFLQMEWGRAVREASPTSLILADIDSFRAFNETRGRLAGDDLLRQVAAQLATTVRRPMDFLGRFDEDAFAAVLPATKHQGVAFLAERMRQRVQALGLTHPASPVSDSVTASVGGATTVPIRGATPTVLIDVARRALDEAREAGGNRSRCLEVT